MTFRGMALAISISAMAFGCSDGGGQGPAGPAGGQTWDPPGGGGQPQSSLPGELAQSWYAGQGYTTVPYDPSSGAWGTPSGKGLIYVFEQNGKYQKAFQSYESSGGCTTGFTAFEYGTAQVDGNQLTLTPTSGHLKYTASCAPSLDSDDPLYDLATERFTWSMGFSEYDPALPTLHLEAPDGASATFTPL